MHKDDIKNLKTGYHHHRSERSQRKEQVQSLANKTDKE